MIKLKQGLFACGRRFAAAQGGNIVITSALAMPVLIGMVALSVEYGGGLMKRVENQRVADLAAFAAATAYGAKNTEDAMRQAAWNIAQLNGLDQDALTVALVNSPRTAGSMAVQVDVSTRQTLYLARVLGDFEQLQVKAGAMAEVGSKPSEPGCVYALSSSESGISLSGGTQLQAKNCTVASNNTITVPCGTKITTKAASYNGAAPNQHSCKGIVKEDGSSAPLNKTQTDDPLAGHAGIAAAVARLTDVSKLAAPAAPTVSEKAQISFGYGLGETQTRAMEAGCTAATIGDQWSGKWRVTCPRADKPSLRKFEFGAFRNAAATVEIIGPADAVYNFSGLVENAGAGIVFGSGNYNLAKGVKNGGNGSVTFGAGSFRIGRADVDCNSGIKASICVVGSASLTFGGPSTFELQGGLLLDGAGTIQFGSGTINSYKIGPTSNGAAAVLKGSGQARFADATGSNSVFQMYGHMDSTKGGGSCIIFPAAEQHDINGNIDVGGGVVMGAGTYTVDGYVAFGSDAGGGGNCFEHNYISLKANDVSLIISGKTAPGGNCKASPSFCAGAGFDNLTLNAPSSGPLAKIAIIGPQITTNKRGLTMTAGASAKISGVVYFPYGPFNMSGGAGVGSNGCLQIIGSSITLLNGATTTSECIAAGGGSAAKQVVLVQ